MKFPENIKNRIFLIAASIASYFLIPIPLGLMIFTFFHPSSFPFAGYIVYAIQICVSLILFYGAFEWVKPSELYQTGLHSKYYSVLDFVFIANKPPNWSVDSRILKDNFPFPDNIQTSDHRPIKGRILID